MPVSIALLFCIPIGFAFYYEGRWLIRWATGRFGLKERRATLAFAVFGGLLIPSVYCSSLAMDAFPGNVKKWIATAIVGVPATGIAAIAGSMFVTEKKEAK